MNYGNANDVTEFCGRCGERIDKHKPFNIIRSDERTEKLAKSMQKALDGVAIHAIKKGYDSGTDITMVGAATATIKNEYIEFVTVSGPGVELLSYIQGLNLGNKVKVIDVYNATPLRTLMGKPLNPTITKQGRNRDYPIGSCAAQKLLAAIFQEAQKKGGGKFIEAINMAEILWNNPSISGHNPDWSTGQIVGSCDTCKQVAPQMLCDFVSD